jgi:ABC-2 type transport system permease protein
MKWWRSVFAMELRKILAYRTDFWLTFLGQTFIQLFIARALWQAVFEVQGTQQMQGFSLETMTLYYLIAPLGTRMLTGENIGFISREIYDGTFTRYLIYPLSVFQYKMVTYLTHSAFYGLQLCFLYMLYHLVYIQSGIGDVGPLLLGVCLFFVASFTYALMAMLIELIALWAENIWSLVVMLRFFTNFLGGGFLPLTFFPRWSVEVLQYTPFPYLVSLPIRTVMGLTSAQEIFQGLLINMFWSTLLMGAISLVWRKGEKSYTGVGL